MGDGSYGRGRWFGIKPEHEKTVEQLRGADRPLDMKRAVEVYCRINSLPFGTDFLFNATLSQKLGSEKPYLAV